MTNDDAIKLAVSDAAVIDAHTTRDKDGNPVPPNNAALLDIARTELENEINALLSYQSIRRRSLERDYTLTLSTGTSNSRGLLFTLPDYVASVEGITIGTGSRKLTQLASRDDFDRWYYNNFGTSESSQTSEVWLVWNVENNVIQIMLSPGAGSDTTALVHYVRHPSDPPSINDIPAQAQFLVVTGLKRRMTGGRLYSEYENDLKRVLKLLSPRVGGVSPMPLGADQEDFNWLQSVESASVDSSGSPFFVSRRQ